MDKRELQLRLRDDPVFFSRLTLPEWFSLSAPPFHREIYKPLMDRDVKLLVVKMPRGFGKTTILQGFVMQQIVHKEHPVIVYISDTYTQAEFHTETMRAELEENEKITGLFGPQEGRKWTSSLWTTSGGVSVVPKGSNQSIRGLKIGSSRPSLVIIDDPENDENTETPEQREKLWRHIFAVIKPMMQSGADNVKIVYLGTPIHEDCVLLRLIELLKKEPFCNDPGIRVVELSARDEEGESIWPELWSPERLRDEELLYAEAGQLDTFYREYLGEVIARKGSEFPLDGASYYLEHELPDDLMTYASLDMAFSQNRAADYCAVVIASVSGKADAVFIREASRVRMKPNKFIQYLSDLHKIYGPIRWFVQNVTLDEFFQFYARESGFYLPFEKVKISRAKNAKIRRIASLSPLYITKRLKFLKGQTDLIGELTSFPRAKHDDLGDALAELVQQVYVPQWTPKVVRQTVQGSLEFIEAGLRRRASGGRMGLSFVPRVVNGRG